MGKFLQNKNIRKLILLVLDLVLINLSALLSLEVRFDFDMNPQHALYKLTFLNHFWIYSIISICVMYFFGLYKSLWRYASVNELLSIVLAAFWSNTALYVAFQVLDINMPRSFYIINIFIMTSLMGGLRFSYRVVRRLKMGLPADKKAPKSRVLIIGAGDAGHMTAKELMKSYSLNKIPVGFLDDDPNKTGKDINGIPVLGRIKDAKNFIADIDEIIIALPSISSKRKKEIIDQFKNLGIKIKLLPGIYELIDGKVDVKQIRDVQIEDLLGRESIKLENPDIESYIKAQTVLVTGGGGSIGSELCRQIAGFKPKRLIILDIYENNAYDIQNELLRTYPQLDLHVLIGSVRDNDRLNEIFAEHSPDIIFHAAAHKHVPLMQESPFEAIKNNLNGTINTALMAGKYNAKRFVLISTDKAVNPTNIMGASKRLSEIAIQEINLECTDTEFVAVRFGNVLGSNGSVIPLFKKQIELGGPVKVTHPDIIRYFMTIPEAVQLVLEAGAMAKGGEIFVLDMGEPVKIVTLAEDLIRLSGFEPYEDIDIQFTGLRPGEKLYEELLLAEEGISDTCNNKIFTAKPLEYPKDFIEETIMKIKKSAIEHDLEEMEKHIKKLIPLYKSKEKI